MEKSIENSAKSQSDGMGPLGEVYEWVEAVVFSLAFVILVFTVAFRPVGVEGVSMENTLNKGVQLETQFQDRLLITNFHYAPGRGDIVVIHTDAKEVAGGLIIKRVIAVGGDTVNIDFDSHTVYVNGKALSEPYIKEPTSLRGNTVFPETIPAGKYFVMGDNRNDSFDSRFTQIGLIDRHDIIGKAFFRVYPFSIFGPIK